MFKGAVMQTEKTLINNHVLVSEVSGKFRISCIYNFAVICLSSLLFFKKEGYFLTVSIVFSVYKQNFTAY